MKPFSRAWFRFWSLLTAVVLLSLPGTLRGQSALRGSTASMDRQEEQASRHDFSYLRDAAQVRRFVANGLLVPVRGNEHYEIHGVSFPWARPEVRTFVERLASQYRSACGEKLVVTSLTRPLAHQPRNASERSVHPTGMAVDLRIPSSSRCRKWLEGVLLSLEKQGVLEATRERRPPHYHIAVFPQPYARYVQARGGKVAVPASWTAQASDGLDAVRRAAAPGAQTSRTAEAAASGTGAYRVRRGDSLWRIARAHGTTVDRLLEANGLAEPRIIPGQLLRVPGEAN